MGDANRLREPCVLDKMHLASGQYSRLHRMMYEYGTANGTLLLLLCERIFLIFLVEAEGTGNMASVTTGPYLRI